MSAALWYATYSLSTIPIAIAWWRWRVDLYARTRIVLTSLFVASASQIWILSAFAGQWTLGPAYSHLRYGIIAANIVADLGVTAISIAVLVAGRPKIQAILTGIGSLILSAVWLLIGAANSVA